MIIDDNGITGVEEAEDILLEENVEDCVVGAATAIVNDWSAIVSGNDVAARAAAGPVGPALAASAAAKKTPHSKRIFCTGNYMLTRIRCGMPSRYSW